MPDSDDLSISNDSGQQELTADGPTLISADPQHGFNYPYYLAVPDRAEEPWAGEAASSTDVTQCPILVEPHNVGERIDDFERHLELAKQRIQTQSGRYIADELGVPILVPVFPRPFAEPVDWTHMIHMLCAQTIQINDGPLERVDRQLLAMVEDARARLADSGIVTSEKFILNGFSAAAAFVNRFAALHPSRVCSVSAGGLNGLAILPQTTADLRGFGERPMNYPVGVANIKELTGKSFDRDAFCELHQFIYMGSDDDKDALLYPDAWTDPELRGVAVLTYGEDIHQERFPHCREAYNKADANAVFRVYEAVGHTPEPALDDIVEFHARSLNGDNIESIRDDLSGSNRL
jgi:hypothetical protein